MWLAKRLVSLIITFWGITLLSFFIIHLAPGEPLSPMMDFNPKFTPEMRERLIAQYGLDKPLYIQYLKWMKGLLHLDLGRSFAPDRRPVWDKIKERLPVTLLINLLSLLLIFLVACPLGIISAVKKNSLFDRTTTIIVFIGYALPGFWLALMLMMLLGIKWHLLPISGLHSLMGYENLSFGKKILDWGKHLLLPLFVSAFGGMAGLSRFMRSSMIEVLNQDYITTARAKGLPERVVIYKHALKNALLPVITLLGLSIPGLVGGSVIFESIFSIPGIGQLMWQAVMARDYPVIMGNLVIVSILTLLGNLIADIGYALADPRIKWEGK